MAEGCYPVLEPRVCASLKVKPEKFKKMTDFEPGRRIMYEFIEKTEFRRLLIYDGGKDLVADTGIPVGLKRKACYFIKRNNIPLNADNVKKELIFGEVIPNILDQVSQISQEIYMPLLANMKNQEGWPEVMGKEIVENYHRFLGHLYVTIGQTQGMTLLPLPPADSGAAPLSNADRAARDKERVHNLESAVVTWTRLIKNVLRTDPEDVLKSGGHPGPLAEVEFWISKAANLNSIDEQLNGNKVKKVIKILEMTRSTYFPAFNRLCKEVAQSRIEANDNASYLKRLKKWLIMINQTVNFGQLPDLFWPTMHCIMLVWKHSNFYNTPTRLVVLIRELCNDVIDKASAFVNAADIFKIEPYEAVDRLRTTIQVCDALKASYDEYKRKTASLGNSAWRTQNVALFSRLDAFSDRCHDIMELCATSLQFNKLERIEIGGTKGRHLSASVRQIFADFQQAFHVFQALPYNILDVEKKNFEDDFYAFRSQIKELERRLGSIITQGLDDCTTVSSAFKLVESFEGLLDRDIIAADVEKKHGDLIAAYREDLKKVQELFFEHRNNPPIFFNMPPVAGSLMWCRGLLERFEEPMEKFRQMNKGILDSEEGREVVKLYNTLIEDLKIYEKEQYTNWERGVEDVSQEKLKQSLLRKDNQKKCLVVNFNPALVKLLREVKYFILLKMEIPDSAMQIFKKAEVFRTQIGNLELIVNTYNSMLATLLDVELPLIQKQLSAVDKLLEKGLKHLNWKSHGIVDFISEAMSKVKGTDQILRTLKGDVREIEKILESWFTEPLFKRKEDKTYTVDDFKAQQQNTYDTRTSLIIEGAQDVHKFLLNSNKVLKVSKGVPAWKNYGDYVNDIVMKGIEHAIANSLSYVRTQLDPVSLVKSEINPLLEIKLELLAPNIVFNPDLGYTANRDGLRDDINRWISEFFSVSTLIKRLDTGDGDYMQEMTESELLLGLVNDINNFVAQNEVKCNEFRQQFLAFSYLWTDDLQSTFNQFLESKRPSPTKPPPLSEFDAQVAKYKPIQDAIQALPNISNIGWLRVDAKPVKQALATWVSKWCYMYINYLSTYVTNSINDFLQLQAVVTNGLQKEAEGGEVLLEMMGYLRDVRLSTQKYDDIWEPLRQTVLLLKKYDTLLPENIMRNLEEGPVMWNNLKKLCFNVKETLTPYQNVETEKLKSRQQKFAERVSNFRANFKRAAPFKFNEDYAGSYEAIDTYQMSLFQLEVEAVQLNELQELFELTVVQYKDLKETRQELVLLKNLWDSICMTQCCIQTWKQTLWAEIDVDFLVIECNKLLKEVRLLDKQCRAWDGYKGVEDSVKNLITSLPLVQELHSPAMRDRHWKHLMRATGVVIHIDETFSLASMLALQLHNYVEVVAEIVDRANKELIIENNLKKIEAVWRSLKLEFIAFEESETMILQAPDSIMESLEENLVQVQNMMAGKYVANNPHFSEDVHRWLVRLGNVDTNLNLWLEVQQKWTSLESIFIGSADIRTQLPEDSKRFDLVDLEWKELMKEAQEKPLAVEACNVDGRQRLLEEMKMMLEQCEKSLAEYLETKRVAFPRFYFVSSADLVDILSKGSNPHAVQKHMAKCFDNIQKLEFMLDKEGRLTHYAIGMHSKEKEYVAFAKPYLCEGAVEVWMNGLVDAMRDALKFRLEEAVAAFDEKPRDKWVFDHCAQIAIVVCRIMYTAEVVYAFEQISEGQEQAMREYNKKQQQHLSAMTELIVQDLTDNDRRKVITLVTVDVHNRDVVARLVQDKAESVDCFQWLCQLRYSMDEATKCCKINICDFDFSYQYEYIGNCGCLVITPLTDRCYITLTQAIRLNMGGAPAGPAGTGKTETTKDLGRAMGVMVYVFNCSDQMDYKTMGSIYKGLAQTGAWGCFDEFNRISVEVLSVCSTQYKCILDAIRGRKQRFLFEDEEIKLMATCCAFVTMNPGYAGRTELPESLKALFRPVAMIVPDMDLITEIMLMSEGFQDGKVLARKFMILYRLCQDLLSSQIHYDWKLRAVKTTLNVAGGLKRADRTMSEDKVLLRALRDFNIGKLVTDDIPIFMGLLEDLFPKTLEQVQRKRDLKFEEVVKHVCTEHGLQADPNFITKVVQLRELFVVRWSVFLLGPAGCGKSEVWKNLARAQIKFGEKTSFQALNPKAVTRNELYGFMNPATREWKDGLISQIFRDYANASNCPHQWIVMDGDIDAEWIESMNTVMDDNKMLTLASNERIPLTPTMRLLFEIENMRNASPATVSRGGVIFLNSTDVGWNPFVQSWIATRPDMIQRIALEKLFEKYAEVSLNHVRKSFKMIVPITEINMVWTWCHILEGLLDRHAELSSTTAPPPAAAAGGAAANPPAPVSVVVQSSDDKMYELYFVFAAVWALAGACAKDKTYGGDMRDNFSKWWREEWKTVKFPDVGSVFDFFVDPEQCTFVPWTEKTPVYMHLPDSLFGDIFVPTADTARLTFLLDLLERNRHNIMFVGTAGTGKTTIMKEKLRGMDLEKCATVSINFNCFTDSLTLQHILESALEKKTGRVFGPPGQRKLIYFIDDLNMPSVDKYGTQTPIALLRQHMDYQQVYDRNKLSVKEIHNCHYMACMNPTAGSFNVDPRLQRQFATFAIQFPTQEDLMAIYGSVLAGHLSKFEPMVAALANNVVRACMDLHKTVSETFFPTAVKFHYQFNLRDLSNVFQGVCLSTSEFYTNPINLVRLWMHECDRTYGDRLISEQDINRFQEVLTDTAKKFFEDLDQNMLCARPLIINSFTSPSGDESLCYVAVSDYAKLRKVLEEKLAEYNDTKVQMNLVLFEQAMEHVCRITRIIQSPRGNALLVGVGGSGKQSLARLASFICGYEVFQISVTQSYGLAEFRADLQSLYVRTGIKSLKIAFILTDGQIVDERFMVYINDLLSSGFIPDLFTSDERDNLNNGVRSEVKQEGVVDTKENCWEFFIEKVRKNLHVILCVSPVGDKFRVRARQFPAMINCTVIDWFHEWLPEALVAVAQKFLKDIDHITPEVRESMAHHMAFIHSTANQASAQYVEQERRYNYTTPKTFLELISLFKGMLHKKRSEIHELKGRLQNGVIKLRDTEAKVSDLQEKLKHEMQIVEERKAVTDKLLVEVAREQEIAEEQKAIAAVKETKSTEVAKEVAEIQTQCSEDVALAEPIIQQAEAALNSLDKKALTELKAFASPAPEIVDVGKAVMVLTAPGGRIPRDLSWAAFKKYMGAVERFLYSLQHFDKDNMPEQCCAYVEKNFLSAFDPETMKNKSLAASGLCKWCLNVCKYFRIYQNVQPKRDKLAEANRKLDEANRILELDRRKLADLEARLHNLTTQFEKATMEKNIAMQQAERTQQRADIANRLINGLADEKVRWTESIEKFSIVEKMLVGDVLLSAAFISYIGAFNSKFRASLVNDRWIPDLIERQIPLTEAITPLTKITDEAEIAKWANEGLPTDQVSIENGAIMTNCTRWPLMIDPQLQGYNWIRNREAKTALKIVQQGQPKYMDVIENAIQTGLPVLIENLGEALEAVLEPILSRATIRKGRNVYIKIGDKELEWDANFRLYLQTKLPNPHYKPEVAAQCTLINFTVTEQGLDEQFLAMVVNKDRPELELQRAELLRQQNDFKITLKELEDNLLFRLSNAEGDILDDADLILNLETTKATAKEIAEKLILAKKTDQEISAAREVYRPVAVRGGVIYFLVDSLHVLDHMYQYSMANFVVLMKKGMERAEPSTDTAQRVANLIDSVTYTLYASISSGLFERHKLIFKTQLCLLTLGRDNAVDPELVNFLLRGTSLIAEENPCKEWLPDTSWATLLALKDLAEAFENLPSDVEGSAKRWREWCELERPEIEPLPADWKKLPDFQKLLVIKGMRPDRMTEAMLHFVKHAMGDKYVAPQNFNLEVSYQDARSSTPVFFILSPGVDPVKDVELLGKRLKYTYDAGNLAIVSLGQGQEPVAERALDKAHANGGWVILQNIHLTPKWTGGWLERRLDKIAAGAHQDFRLFLSAEPTDEMPINILQACVKLTNEPPDGLKANILRAFSVFTDEMFETANKPAEYKAIVYALCVFHAIVNERKKFGAQGWNRVYPFNLGDLTSSAMVCNNYLEAGSNTKIPWDDLRYIFGEIMYGGHITDDWDRRLCSSYLTTFLKDDLIEGMELYPAFPTPKTWQNNFRSFGKYVEDRMPPESPVAFGLHANAEIGFRLAQADNLFRSIIDMQPRTSTAGGISLQDKSKNVLEEVMEKLPPDQFALHEIAEKLEERTPYTGVFLQEIERMNLLLFEIKRSLNELDLGLKGDLTITESMEALMKALADDKVPSTWERYAYPSVRPLASWIVNLMERIKQLSEWAQDPQLPKVTWISGLFNPQSFLTAVMQTTARKNEWALDRTMIQTEVTRKSAEDIELGAREGAYIHGLILEGARWDDLKASLDDSRPKELYCKMPVILARAVPADIGEGRNVYHCPVYKTQRRGPTWVFTAGLASRHPQVKWILAGVALLMDVVK